MNGCFQEWYTYVKDLPGDKSCKFRRLLIKTCGWFVLGQNHPSRSVRIVLVHCFAPYPVTIHFVGNILSNLIPT